VQVPPPSQPPPPRQPPAPRQTPSALGKDGESDLLPGWKATTAPDGRTYYYHAVRQETQWERPVKPAARAVTDDDDDDQAPPPPPDGFSGVFTTGDDAGAQPPARRLSGGYNNVWTKQPAKGGRNSWRTIDETSTAVVDDEWYYLGAAHEQKGPHTSAWIHGLVRSGAVASTTLAWKDGLATWTAISKLPELQPPPTPTADERRPPAPRPRGNSRPPPTGIPTPSPVHAFPPPPRAAAQQNVGKHKTSPITHTAMNAAI